MHAFVTYFRPVSLPINGSPPHDRVPIFRVGNLKRERKRYPLVVSRFSLFYYARFVQFEKYLLFEIRARVFVHACGKASKDSGKIGWKSVALFLERASSVERRSPESSNESQSISRRVLVACSTSYNATVSDSYRFRHFRGMRTLSSRALNNSIRRSFLSLSLSVLIPKGEISSL